MEVNVPKELAALQRMGVAALREKYAEVFGEATGNRTWLIRRIAWRIQADAEGDLSERARKRAEELARDADLRITPSPGPPATSACRARRSTSGRRRSAPRSRRRAFATTCDRFPTLRARPV